MCFDLDKEEDHKNQVFQVILLKLDNLAHCLSTWRKQNAKVQHLTFTLVLIPGVDTVLHAITHQCVVYAHVAVTEEGICITGS